MIISRPHQSLQLSTINHISLKSLASHGTHETTTTTKYRGIHYTLPSTVFASTLLRTRPGVLSIPSLRDQSPRSRGRRCQTIARLETGWTRIAYAKDLKRHLPIIQDVGISQRGTAAGMNIAAVAVTA
ncbi:hypothetical protein CDEST_14709 [Colletotrichum destructivum]|uniref:Uncharacterized protein n=1 Tax=Colletotrichum destructivum TaxID=34406 RepID=A0AAX4J2N3_9PEZI|nr:hypothetical protein CDEST_14709 [Colletotrichum destructivum]